MQTSIHRTNTDFGLRYFLAGSCSTPDGAWALLYGQKIDMESRIKHARSHALRRNALKRRLADAVPQSADWYDAKAALVDFDAEMGTHRENMRGAKRELATIKRLMDEVEPQCRYRELPLHDRIEACREEEWLGELIRRAENFIITQGTIPHDHFDTMRMHPRFRDAILPRIVELRQAVVRLNPAVTTAADISRLLPASPLQLEPPA